MTDLVPIPRHHLQEICKPGQGPATCRYVAVADIGWTCAKHSGSLALEIDARVAAGTMKAIGDNCPGLTA